MIRRTLTALLVSATALSGLALVSPADAATPGGTCTLTLPSRISVNSLFVERTARASGSCTKAEAEALWSTDPLDVSEDEEFDFPGGIAMYARGHNIYGPGGSYYGPYGITLVFGDSVHWGINTFAPVYAGRGCNDDGRCKVTYTQNSPTSDVRLGTRSTLRAHRHKGVVKLVGHGRVYAPYRDGFKGRIFNAAFQTRSGSGQAWQTVRTVKTGFKGYSTVRVRAHRGMQYRFVTLSDAHWWTSVSPRRTR